MKKRSPGLKVMINRYLLCLSILLMISYAASTSVQTPLWKTTPDIPAMPKADEEGLAPVNDIKMYYAIFNKGGKNPVLLLHGGFANADFWAFEVPLLAKTHEVIVADSRGHGRSTMTDQPFTYNLLSADVLQLMDHLKIKKASVVGWSDGGIIGLILAVYHPERINKIFTYGANFNLSGYQTGGPVDTAMSARFMAKVKADYRRLSPTPNDFIRFRTAIGKMYEVEPNLDPQELKTIKAPTVIARGQYEQFIKPEHFEEMARLIPGAKLVVLPNVSHGGPLQDPVAFHRAVSDLLDAGH